MKRAIEKAALIGIIAGVGLSGQMRAHGIRR